MSEELKERVLEAEKEVKVGKDPQDVCVREDGKMVVAEWGASLVRLLSASGEEEHKFNVDGKGDGRLQLNKPFGVCEDEKYTYVSDEGNHRVVVYDKRTREVVRILCGNGEGDGENQLKYPQQVRVLGKFLYVADGVEKVFEVDFLGLGY